MHLKCVCVVFLSKTNVIQKLVTQKCNYKMVGDEKWQAYRRKAKLIYANPGYLFPVFNTIMFFFPPRFSFSYDMNMYFMYLHFKSRLQKCFLWHEHEKKHLHSSKLYPQVTFTQFLNVSLGFVLRLTVGDGIDLIIRKCWEVSY